MENGSGSVLTAAPAGSGNELSSGGMTAPSRSTGKTAEALRARLMAPLPPLIAVDEEDRSGRFSPAPA